MWTIIKSFFSKQKYYAKLINVNGDVTWLMEFSDIFKLLQKTAECDVVEIEGKATLVIGKR